MQVDMMLSHVYCHLLFSLVQQRFPNKQTTSIIFVDLVQGHPFLFRQGEGARGEVFLWTIIPLFLCVLSSSPSSSVRFSSIAIFFCL
mmetsp:Transcript_1564/g.2253  ORF Transcript_1564/g.2253 Transcript_1564/m.2253 type:complete len:87 (-) Transcript_1564:2187-2447(-)